MCTYCSHARRWCPILSLFLPSILYTPVCECVHQTSIPTLHLPSIWTIAIPRPPSSAACSKAVAGTEARAFLANAATLLSLKGGARHGPGQSGSRRTPLNHLCVPFPLLAQLDADVATTFPPPGHVSTACLGPSLSIDPRGLSHCSVRGPFRQNWPFSLLACVSSSLPFPVYRLSRFSKPSPSAAGVRFSLDPALAPLHVHL
eukprot:EG_transcript_25372